MLWPPISFLRWGLAQSTYAWSSTSRSMACRGVNSNLSEQWGTSLHDLTRCHVHVALTEYMVQNLVHNHLSCFVDVQAATMPCLLAAGRDESAQGGVFACACSALLTIHRRCFDTLLSPQCSAAGSNGAFLAWDAASVMKRERARVLQGCVLHLASCAAVLRVRYSLPHETL